MDFGDELFFHAHERTEHLNELGRAKLAQMIVSALDGLGSAAETFYEQSQDELAQ